MVRESMLNPDPQCALPDIIFGWTLANGRSDQHPTPRVSRQARRDDSRRGRSWPARRPRARAR